MRKNTGSRREEIIVKGSTIKINGFKSQISNALRSCGTLLPTFSAEIGDGRVIRCLKDCGAQKNFIKQSVVESGVFRIVRSNVDITITGFNSPSQHCTNIVTVEMMFGRTKRTLEAYVIPEFDAKMKLRGLSKITDWMVSNGFKLADKFLYAGEDYIDNIEFVLGASSIHRLQERNILFGDDDCCQFSQTPLGFMMWGDLDVIEENLELLEESSDYMDLQLRNQTPAGAQMSLQVLGRGSNEDSVELSSMNNSSRADSGVSFSCTVLDDSGEVNDLKLKEALESQLIDSYDNIIEGKCINYANYENQISKWSDIDNEMVDRALDNLRVDEDGRLVVPLLWNERVASGLGTNYHLAKSILLTNLQKLKNKPEHLKLIDDAFSEQLDRGIITRVDNVKSLVRNRKDISFLGHMPIIKTNNESTKCRNVMLSNICEKLKDGKPAYSHNQAMHSGPTLNRKLSTAIIQVRFDTRVLLYDLEKAFLTLGLKADDKNKLLFLWFKDVKNGDFSIIGYRSERLPFGLRCSPCLLMLAMYYILMVDTGSDGDDALHLKRSLYNNLYMDNGAVTGNSSEYMEWAYDKLFLIFNKYKFGLQQFVTNDDSLKRKIESKDEEVVEAKLMGLRWNTVEDTIKTVKLYLNPEARTKREILSSIASNFDLFGFCGPILNRPRLFLHKLQKNTSMGWDKILSEGDCKEWRTIVKSVNKSMEFSIARSVGRRTDSYQLICCTDSSKSIFGTVVYLYNENTQKLSFLIARNRLIGKKLEHNTIPTLEMLALELGVETSIDLYNELTGDAAVIPIVITDIKVYLDSLVCIHWLNSYVNRIDKMKNVSVLVRNRLNNISKLCDIHPVKFIFCAGKENPADFISRSCSARTVSRSNYFSGIPVSMIEDVDEFQSISVPNTNIPSDPVIGATAVMGDPLGQYIVQPSEFSSFKRIFKVYRCVLKFVNNLKIRLNEKSRDNRFEVQTDERLGDSVVNLLMKHDQQEHFADLIDFFRNRPGQVNQIPDIITKLNIILDDDGLLYVKSKLKTWGVERSFPILLAKNSVLAKLLVWDTHVKKSHAGVYSVLAEVRKYVYIPHVYSFVKKTLKNCVHCRRFNGRPVSLNQNEYRDFRIDPPSVPFNYIYIDFLGPFQVNIRNQRSKGYILIISCLWSRAVNLVYCEDLTNRSFIRGFQCHILEHGLPALCWSDAGSQLTSSAKIIHKILHMEETRTYLEEAGVAITSFNSYPKGCNQLGGIVESLVKIVKRIIYGAVGNKILDIFDFLHLVKHAAHICNRRPVAYKAALRDGSVDHEIPHAITPENLVKGRELAVVSVIPSKTREEQRDPTWMTNPDGGFHLSDSFTKLNQARERINELYKEEFLPGLVNQATNLAGRYKPVRHEKLENGDIVLLKENLVKPCNFAMGKVIKVTQNELGETTSAMVFKGSTRETVYRHATSLIPLYSPGTMNKAEQGEVSASASENENHDETLSKEEGRQSLKRRAAQKCDRLNKALLGGAES